MRDPIADAKDALTKKDYRLFFIPHGMGTGEFPATKCVVRPIEGHYFSRGIINDARYGQEQIKYEMALRTYGARYNHHIVSSADYPLSDFCRIATLKYLTGNERTTAFHPPSGPKDISLIGAIRRGNGSQISTLLEKNEKHGRILGLSPLAWAALRGDEDIFNYLYIDMGIKPSKVFDQKTSSIPITTVAAIGGNSSILNRLIKDGYDFSLVNTGHHSKIIATLITPEIFDVITKQVPYSEEQLPRFYRQAIKGENYTLAWHMFKNKLISSDDFLISALNATSKTLLKKYINSYGMKSFEKEILRLEFSRHQNDLLAFLLEENVSPATLSSLLNKKNNGQRRFYYIYNPPSLDLHKKIFSQYRITSDIAIHSAIANNDQKFLLDILSLMQDRGELTSKYKAKLYISLLGADKTLIHKVNAEFQLDFLKILHTSYCDLISKSFKLLSLPHKNATISYILDNLQRLNECNDGWFGRGNWQNIIEHASYDDLLHLLDQIRQSTSLSNEIKERIYSAMAVPAIRSRVDNFAHHYIQARYDNQPDISTLKKMHFDAIYALTDKALRQLLDLGLDPNEYLNTRLVPAFQIFNINHDTNTKGLKTVKSIEQEMFLKVKAYLDYGFDASVSSPWEGSFPMAACLYIGDIAKPLFNEHESECNEGLNIRALQSSIIEKNETKAKQALYKLSGSWEKLRGWHQPILKGLLANKLYNTFIYLTSKLPPPESWRHERERSDKHPYGGLNDNKFWNRTEFDRRLNYKNLISMAFKTENKDIIVAVLNYYSGNIRMKQYEDVSEAAQYVTNKTYPLFVRALKDHDISPNSYKLRRFIVAGSLEDSLKSKNVTQLTNILYTLLRKIKINEAQNLLAQMQIQGIAIDKRHKDKLSLFAESLGLYDLARTIQSNHVINKSSNEK